MTKHKDFVMSLKFSYTFLLIDYLFLANENFSFPLWYISMNFFHILTNSPGGYQGKIVFIITYEQSKRSRLRVSKPWSRPKIFYDENREIFMSLVTRPNSKILKTEADMRQQICSVLLLYCKTRNNQYNTCYHHVVFGCVGYLALVKLKTL